jgi:hypothetical protein
LLIGTDLTGGHTLTIIGAPHTVGVSGALANGLVEDAADTTASVDTALGDGPLAEGILVTESCCNVVGALHTAERAVRVPSANGLGRASLLGAL